MKVKDAGGTLRTITSFKVKDGSTMRRVLRLKVMDGATLRTVATFATPLAASVSPNPVSGSSHGNLSATTVTSSAATASPGGGLGPYTYSWARISGDTMTAASPSSATTTFSGTVPLDSTNTAVFRVTVTDAAGQVDTADVTVNLTNLPD